MSSLDRQSDFQLTLSCANESPDTFVHQLLKLYGSEHTGAAMRRDVWNKLVKEQKISHQKIHIDPHSWISESRDGHVYLGAAQMNPAMRNQLIFEAETFSYQDEILYRFSHEVAHTVAYDLYEKYPEMTQLFQVINTNRSQNKGGFSSIGNVDFYQQQGINIQSTEDLTELVNMYLIDPNYLQRYLEFLANAQYQAVRAEIGLTTITTPVVQYIFKTIQQSVKKWMSSEES